MRIGSATAVASNASATASADCDAGEMATGGGFFSQVDVQVTTSRPVPLTAGAEATGWQATVKEHHCVVCLLRRLHDVHANSLT